MCFYVCIICVSVLREYVCVLCMNCVIVLCVGVRMCAYM